MDCNAHRRSVLAAIVGLAASAPAPACAQVIYAMRVWRDPNCGCCHGWTARLLESGRFTISVVNDLDMAATKRRLGVPLDLASCHTALVQGYAIEGHVPVADIVRLVSGQPRGVLGLAVPGMPIGSPGMEAPGAPNDAYEVIAFHADGSRSVFARYAGG